MIMLRFIAVLIAALFIQQAHADQFIPLQADHGIQKYIKRNAPTELHAAAPRIRLAQSLLLLGAGGNSPSVSFSMAWESGEVEASGTATVSYNCASSCAFGAADPNRYIVVFAGSRITSGSISSMTIGGVAATQVSGAASSNGSAVTDIWIAPVPTGTNGTISITWSASNFRTGISVYRLVTAHPTANNTQIAETASVVTTLSLPALTIPTGGAGISGIYFQAQAPTVTWVNATGDFQTANTSTIATATDTGIGSITVTANFGSSQPVMSAASWGP